MSNTKENKVKKFFQKFIKPLFRGVIKSLPFGNVAIEIGDNIKKETTGEPKNHNWVSITIQLLLIGAIVWALLTKQITIETFIDLVNNLD
jgi:hypothetical protein